ncbi:MAG: tripartite tricarboxylate transporter substrate binding protein [Candidatus Accumulibacter sp.]|nr:tripartite tricarboxylate transporter substrate binding protein [Accumulibacter sp.]
MKAIRLITALVAAVSISPLASAQDYPTKPIKVYVGYTPGGAVDIVARTVGQKVSEGLGQPIVVENKPGAGTNIAVRALIDSPPDGYTLMVSANALTANPALYQPAPFDPERDVAPISLIGRVPCVIATSANSEFTNLAKLIEIAKNKPGGISFASPGNGATPHLAFELFAHAAGISLQHVPYRGGSQAIVDVIGGQLPLVAVNALEALPHVKSGKLRLLAVMTEKRASIFPDTPTIAESGFPGFEASVWYGFIAPAATPKTIIERLHSEVQKALKAPEVIDRLTAVGGVVSPGTTEQFREMLHNERVRYEKLIREANIKPN